MVEPIRIHVDQILHGYRGGHRRLAGSIQLDDFSSVQMAVMSDLLTSDPLDSTSSYLCGYPLPSAHRYVFARTWAAPEMARPGCVWTHSLVLDYAAVAKLIDPTPLQDLFRRPALDPSGGDYNRSLVIHTAALGQSESFRKSPIQGPDNLEANRAVLALAGLYGDGITHELTICPEDPAKDEALVLALWQQMWPRLRRTFFFATRVSNHPDVMHTGLSIVMSQGLSLGDQDKLIKISRDLVHRPGFKLLLRDLEKRESGPLRRFLWRYSSDARDPRSAGIGLADVYYHLGRSRLREALNSAAMLVRQLFKDDNDCVLLKSDFMIGALHRSSKPDQAWAFLAMLSAFHDRPNFISKSSLDDYFSSLAPDSETIKEIVRAALPGQDDELGGAVIRSVAETLPVADLVEANCNSGGKSRLARVNPGLLSLARFWPTVANERVSMIRELGPNIDLTNVVKGLLPQIGTREIFCLTELHEGPVVMSEIFRALVHLDNDSETLVQVLRAIIKFPHLLGKGLEDAGPIPTFILELLSQCGHQARLEEIMDWSTWALVIDRSNVMPPINGKVYLAAYLFRAALDAPVETSGRLFRLAFDPLHTMAASDNLDGGIREMLARRLPFIGWFRDWDFCAKLRASVAQQYLKSTPLNESILLVTDDPDTLESVLQVIEWGWQGPRLLKELRSRIDEMRDIDGFRVRVLEDVIQQGR